MPYVIANVGRLEYWRPQAFGGPVLRACWSAAQRHTDASHHAWLTLLVGLLDGRGDVWVEDGGERRRACWYGEHVVMLRSTDASALLVPEDLQIMRGIAGQAAWTSYEYAVAHYKDLTCALMPWWSAQARTITASVPIRGQ